MTIDAHEAHLLCIHQKTETHCAFGSEQMPQQMLASHTIISNS